MNINNDLKNIENLIKYAAQKTLASRLPYFFQVPRLAVESALEELGKLRKEAR